MLYLKLNTPMYLCYFKYYFICAIIFLEVKSLRVYVVANNKKVVIMIFWWKRT